MTHAFTWLHLSDLHVTAPDTPEQRRAWKALFDDVEAFSAGDDGMGFSVAGQGPDLIFITGDLTYSGLAAEFELVEEFLARLVTAAGVTRDQIRIVAGNHDVERTRHDPFHSSSAVTAGGEAEVRKRVDWLWTAPHAVAHLEAKFENYLRFAATFRPLDKGLMGTWSETFQKGARKFTIIGLNSAWLCGADSTDGQGMPLIGDYQREVMSAPTEADQADICFVLQHHPIEYLHIVDSRLHAVWLMRQRAICLTGHLHVPEVRQTGSLEGSYLQISGGAGYQGYRGPRRYSWGRVNDAAAVEIELAFRRMSEEGGRSRYVPDGDLYGVAPRGLLRCVRGGAAQNTWKSVRREDEWGFDSTRDLVDPKEVRVCRDSVTIDFSEDRYRIMFRKTVRNETADVLERFYARVAVNAFPDNPVRSREHYRLHPLDLQSVGFYARAGGLDMTWEVAHDDDSNKELFLKFANADCRFPVYPGCETTLEYGFSIGRDQWGPFLQRTVRLPTDVLDCELFFPLEVPVRVWGIERSLHHDNMPLQPPLRVAVEGERRRISWELKKPRRHSSYRLCWRFE